MENWPAIIRENNARHQVNMQELLPLLSRANRVFSDHFPPETHFERSIFINWTCAIADCKYCFLSTLPKHNPQVKVKALRSPESILAEAFLCTALGWKVGYITGGLRVESTEHLIGLVQKIEMVTGEKVIMNFGPYSRPVLEQFQPHILGMGAAIESFNPELHKFICPSKPLLSLLQFLADLQQLQLQKLITIILGIGERKEDLNIVIEKIREYHIEKVQLCFLKFQKNTIFSEVPTPDSHYMAWWIARIRIACPRVIITVALVRNRINDLSLYLQAGANSFTRFMAFSYFASPLAKELEQESQKAGRRLLGQFLTLPKINIPQLVNKLPLNPTLKSRIIPKAEQYYNKLAKRERQQQLVCPA